MRKMRKQRILLALAAMSITFVGVGVAYNDTSINAVAETEAYFTMTDGASIKLSETGCGIRWETKVTEAYISSLNALEDTTITVGTVVYPYQEGVTLTYDMKDANIYEFDLTSLTATENVYTYLAAVTYDNADLTAAQLQQAYKLELTARSYIKYTTAAGVEDVRYMPNEADSARTMEGVANQAAIVDQALPEGDDDKLSTAQQELLKTYINDENPTAMDVGYYEAESGYAFDVENGKYNVYMGTKRVDTVTIANGSFDLNSVISEKGKSYDVSLIGESKIYRATNANCVSGILTAEMFSALDGEAYGENNEQSIVEFLEEKGFTAAATFKQGETTLTYESEKLMDVAPQFIVDDDGYKTGVKNVEVLVTEGDEIAVLNLQAYTKVINEAEDLAVVYGATNVDRPGYYIVQNSFDADGYYLNASISGTHSLTGTFDGNGQTISNLKTAYFGIFQQIGSTGMVKDIAFTNLGQNGASNRVAITYYLYGKVSNVYVSTTDKVIVNAGGLFGDVKATAIVENVVFDASGVTGADDTATSFAPTVNSGATISNSFVISTSYLTKVDSAYTDEITGVKRYADSATMIADKDNNATALATFDSKLWTNDDGELVWNSESVYEKTIKLFDVEDGVSYDGEATLQAAIEEEFGVGAVVTAAVQEDTALTVESGNVIKGVTPSFTYNSASGADSVLSVEIQLTVGDRTVTFKLKAYTKVLNGVEDLSYVNNADTACRDGYYILSSSFSASSYTMAQCNDSYGLTGTLDGNGYTIRDLNVTAYCGFLGRVKGTVKNIALTNVTASSSTSRNAIAATFNNGSKLSNVYISTTNTLLVEAGVLANKINAATIDNVVIDTTGTTGTVTGGSLCNELGTAAPTFTNVFVISAYNLTEAGDTITGVTCYTNSADMGNAEKDLTSFTADFWTTTTGVPVWNTANE